MWVDTSNSDWQRLHSSAPPAPPPPPPPPRRRDEEGDRGPRRWYVEPIILGSSLTMCLGCAILPGATRVAVISAGAFVCGWSVRYFYNEIRRPPPPQNRLARLACAPLTAGCLLAAFAAISAYAVSRDRYYYAPEPASRSIAAAESGRAAGSKRIKLPHGELYWRPAFP